MKLLTVLTLLIAFTLPAFAYPPRGAHKMHKFQKPGWALKNAAKAQTIQKKHSFVEKITIGTIASLGSSLLVLKDDVGVAVEGIGTAVQGLGKAFETVPAVQYVLGVPIDDFGLAISDAGGFVAKN
jgi:hypothetical protein